MFSGSWGFISRSRPANLKTNIHLSTVSIMEKSKKSATKSASKTASKSGSTRSNSSTGSSKPQPTFTQEENQSMLQEYLLEELRDIYWAEKHLVKALPKMAKATSSEELASAFEDHLAATEEQVSRLEQVFELLGEKPRGKKCEAMEGLVEEAEQIIEDTEEGSATRDVALIIAAQKVEHYEIASYGGLTTLAKTLGLEEIAGLLGETLEEEKETDELLTQLAENSINFEAATEDKDTLQESEE
jgi:ferritin-like metal-binding protein YciE